MHLWASQGLVPVGSEQLGSVSGQHRALADELNNELNPVKRAGLKGNVKNERLKRDLGIGLEGLSKQVRDSGTQSLYSNSCKILGLMRQSTLTLT